MEDLLLSPATVWPFLIAADAQSLNRIRQFTQNQTGKRIEDDVNTLIVKKAKPYIILTSHSKCRSPGDVSRTGREEEKSLKANSAGI